MKTPAETDIRNCLIPDYHLLPLEEQSYFETKTEAGQALKSIRQEFEPVKESRFYVLKLLPAYTESAAERIVRMNAAMSLFHKRYQDDPHLLAIHARIGAKILQREIPHIFNYLSPEDQVVLINTDFSQQFIAKMRSSSEEEQAQAYSHFKRQFKKHSLYFSWDKAISLAEKDEAWLAYQCARLAEFAPFLLYQNRNKKEALLEQLKRKTRVQDAFRINLTNTLQKLLYHLAEEASALVPFVPLERFNQSFAYQKALLIVDAFFNQKDFPDTLIYDYQSMLYAYLKQSLRSMHPWPQEKKPAIQKALSFIYQSIKDNTPVGNLKQYIDKRAEAQGFLQATSFTAQTDNLISAGLQLWNLDKHADEIAETKSIFSELTKPFLPIYAEYQHIAKYEKNNFCKIYRSLIPILITVSILILTAALLSLAGLPEFAIALGLIPAFIIGLGLTTLYLQVKDKIYHTLCVYYYSQGSGDVYAIPEFQVSDRMLASFNHNKTLAGDVRDFYIQGLQACDALELAFEQKLVLTKAEQESRAKNIQNRAILQLEWYDIHSNEQLSLDETLAIVLARVQTEGANRYQALAPTFSEEKHILKKQVALLAGIIEEELRKDALGVTSQKASSYEHLSSTPTFFNKPKCFSLKDELDAMDHLMSELPKPI